MSAATPTTHDLRPVAALLARAFHTDPLFTWVVPDPARRARALPGVFLGALHHCRRFGGVVADPPGAAGWVPLHRLELDVLDLLHARLPAAALRLGPRATWRLHAHEAACQRRLAQLAAPDAAYLWMIGVEPARVGEGHGRRVVAAALARAAGSHSQVLLKTEQPRNVALYAHLGFEYLTAVPAPGGGPTSWLMRRALDGAAG